MTRKNQNNSTKNTTRETTDEPVSFTAKDIDPNQIVTVRNGFNGKLVYISPRTHEIFKWESFGDEQEMELRELRNAKSSAKKFFINNWFMFDEANVWVIDYLGLNQYYKNALTLDDFDDLFTKPASEIELIISQLSKGQKQSVAYMARQLILDGKIDSRSVVAALERSLGVDIVER